jgi:hypothetical protein
VALNATGEPRASTPLPRDDANDERMKQANDSGLLASFDEVER